MDVRQMREELLKFYTTQSWKEKQQKMTDAQITAIYLRLKGQGKL